MIVSHCLITTIQTVVTRNVWLIWRFSAHYPLRDNVNLRALVDVLVPTLVFIVADVITDMFDTGIGTTVQTVAVDGMTNFMGFKIPPATWRKLISSVVIHHAYTGIWLCHSAHAPFDTKTRYGYLPFPPLSSPSSRCPQPCAQYFVFFDCLYIMIQI
jgi:hypothetical protein